MAKILLKIRHNSVCGQLVGNWKLPTDAEQYALENATKTGTTCNSTRTGWDCDGAGWGGNKLAGLVLSLPGYRTTGNQFDFRGNVGYWWSSTEIDSISARARNLGNSNNSVSRGFTSKSGGLSVICIKN